MAIFADPAAGIGRLARAAGARRARHACGPQRAPGRRRPAARADRARDPAWPTTPRSTRGLVHPARRDPDPWPRPRPHPHPAQRPPGAQRDPQDHRHGSRPRRSEPSAELSARDRRADRPGRAGAHQLRLAAAREGDRQAHLHDHRAAAQIRRCDPADPLPDRGVRDRLHAADRALLRQAVRGRGQGRDLAAVRDPDRARAGRPGDRRGARRGELSRLCPAPGPALRADRLLGCRPLARPDRRRLRDRAAAPGDRPGAGAPGPARRRARDLRHPWRIDRPRRPSRELRRPPRLRRPAGRARRRSRGSASPASRRSASRAATATSTSARRARRSPR